MTTKGHKGDGTFAIIGAAIRVSTTLGCGFLEKVYEVALLHELRKAGLEVATQVPFAIRYDGIIVGIYRADLIVDGRVIVEVKATRAFDPAHDAQLLNYLKATDLRVGLLFNFGTPRLGIHRMVN